MIGVCCIASTQMHGGCDWQQPLARRPRSLHGSLPPCNPDPADPSLCRVFFFRLRQAGFFAWISRDRMGLAVAGKGLDKCPPAPACGRPLLLYFVQTLTGHDDARLATPGAQIAASLRPPKISPRRAEALACEVKGEVTANGRRRRTFARKGLRPAPARFAVPLRIAPGQRPRLPCQCWYPAWNINTFHRCICLSARRAGVPKPLAAPTRLGLRRQARRSLLS